MIYSYLSNFWQFQFHNTYITKGNQFMKLPFSFQFFSLKIKFKKNLSFYSFKIITNNISVKLSCSSYSDKYFVLADNYGGDWGTVTCTMT